MAARRAARARHRDGEPDFLAPPAAFPETQATPEPRKEHLPQHNGEEIRERSRTVANRLATSCAGWPRRPTPTEFYRALHAGRPTGRQRAIVRVWMSEATNEEITLAWLEEAYTYRDLVSAIHKSGVDYPDLNRELNRLVPG